MYKVYIKTDADNNITHCDGGITLSNITDISEWTLLSEGNDIRHGFCQAHFFEGGLLTHDFISRYKYVGGECVLRSEEEIEEERRSRHAPYDEREDMANALDMLGIT